MNSEASQLKEQDLVQWLDNKLGDPTELWASRQASSLLNEQMLIELETCFQALEPHVKNKILQAMLHLSTKLVQTWRDPLNNLLNLARRDADDWVELVADLFRDFPDQGCIQCRPSNPDSIYYKTLDEMCQRLVKFVDQNPSITILPPDCAPISHSAIMTQYGFKPPPPKKHFTIIRKTKSQQLMEEMDRAAAKLNNPANKKSGGIVSSLPIKMRSTAKNPNNQLPMRGIPSASTSKFSGGFTNEPKKFQRQLVKREGGAKLIDIAELPPQQGGRKRRAPEPKPKPKPRPEDIFVKTLEQRSESATKARPSDNDPLLLQDRKIDVELFYDLR